MSEIVRSLTVAVLGVGEAGTHFANGLASMGVNVRCWDPAPKRALHQHVLFADSNPHAVQGADFVFSVNLAAVALGVAVEVRPHLRASQVYLEMNTAAPALKKAAHRVLEPSGVRFVDLAIMAPVPPAGIRTPMLACGAGAGPFYDAMHPLGLNIEVLEGDVGDAATRKLLRSIVYKGIAAVVGEAIESGRAFGMEGYIRSQISSLVSGGDAVIDRFLEGSRTHAERRMHEMDAVVEMLGAHRVEPLLSRATRDSLKALVEEQAATRPVRG
jgi:3-hydroxyisobutyrate dehydrogenase-like beta-hydroxyacid dehydrogenase